MPKLLRRLLALVMFFLVGGGIVFGGPLVSGAFWLTSPAVQGQSPIELPWLIPYHKGGIDFAAGLYVRTDQDLIVQSGDVPIVLKRTYRTKDKVSRAFGIGANHNGEWYLRGDGQAFQWAELVLDSGTRIDYHRTSPGSSYLNAMYEHRSSPSVFYRSQIGWTGFQWALRWFDGSVAIFRACSDSGPGLCSIREMRTPGGQSIHYLRDRDPYATLLSMRSGAAAISFDYDSERRIVRAKATTGQEVGYEYDSGGRLTRVTESGGTVRKYAYDAQGAMLSIDEPRWHIENSYDEDGRCVRQVTRWPDGDSSTIEVHYKVRNGSIVEASKRWNDGPHTTYHFNDDHYLESEERDPAGPAPVVINYNRTAFGNFATTATVRCYNAEGKLLKKAESEYRGADATDALVQETCGGRP